VNQVDHPVRHADGAATEAALAGVAREHAGRLAAALMRVTGDFATAEDLVQDALETAMRRWPTEGIPARPDAWLFTVARNRGLDVLRREKNYRAKLAQLSWPLESATDVLVVFVPLAVRAYQRR
jgi:predicted RNA polymerase sigma factor